MLTLPAELTRLYDSLLTRLGITLERPAQEGDCFHDAEFPRRVRDCIRLTGN